MNTYQPWWWGRICVIKRWRKDLCNIAQNCGCSQINFWVLSYENRILARKHRYRHLTCGTNTVHDVAVFTMTEHFDRKCKTEMIGIYSIKTLHIKLTLLTNENTIFKYWLSFTFCLLWHHSSIRWNHMVIPVIRINYTIIQYPMAYHGQ